MAGDAAFPRVEGYTITRVIGTGGFSTVYEATQDDIGSTVALKVLNVSIHDEAGARRLDREYRSMGRLRDQPGIVPVYGTARTSEGNAVIVMAFMPGGSLLDRIRRTGPLSGSDAERMAVELAAALAAAHAVGIHHRDIKPENVLFDAYGHASLSDFGLATVEGLRDASQTAASLSPPHAPPERFTGDANPDPVAGDVYSLASTLHQSLTGTPPFGTSDHGGIVGLINRVCNDPIPPIDRPEVPEGLRAAILAGLAKSHTDRPSSVGGFRSIIGGAEARGSEETVTAQPTPTTVLASPIESATRVINAYPSPPPPVGFGNPVRREETSSSRAKQRVVIALAAVCGVAVVAAALMSRSGGGKDAPAAADARTASTTATTVVPTTTTSGRQAPEGVRDVVVGSNPKGIAAGDTTIWVTNSGSNSISSIDARSGTITGTFAVGAYPWGIAIGADAIWVSNRDSGTVSRVDPTTGAVTNVAVGPEPDGITVDLDGKVWVAMPRGNVVTEIDPSTVTVITSVPADGQPRGVASQGNVLWIRDYAARKVRGIDLDANANVCPTTLNGGPYDLAVERDAVWVSIPENRFIVRISRSTCEVSQIDVGVRPYGIAVDNGGAVWFTERDGNAAYRFDPATGRTVQRIAVGSQPDAVAARNGVAWISNSGSNTVSIAGR